MVRGQVPDEEVKERLKEVESSEAQRPPAEHLGSDSEQNSDGETNGIQKARGEAEALHRTLRQSCEEMALNRIDGQDELFVGGIWALRRPSALKERNITHILSVVRFDPAGLKSETDTWENYGKSYKHMVIDIDDVEDADILVHLPQAVRFIENGLRGNTAEKHGEDNDRDEAKKEKSFEAKAKRLREAVERDDDASSSSDSETAADPDAIMPIPVFRDLNIGPGGENPDGKPGAVYVHCAMGKSRSVTAVVAYLLWKYPSRFGRSAESTVAAQKASKPDEGATERAAAAVEAAVKWVRKTREIAEPNPGFIKQLEMWWAMGCPDDVESHPIYKRWDFRREIDESVAAGQAPSRLRFEDEETSREEVQSVKGAELRCKKCRRTLATPRFVLAHEPEGARGEACGHLFVEPLSWMRDELEKGTLEGRLSCPNAKCGAAVGRYSWKGFRCNCGAWVTPGFSLQRSRVDEVVARAPGANLASLGIRMPPGTGRL
ncbi:Tyrosine-protein phosphatase yvh1 [Colletotrichum chlorophyti]|uniref:protein-tyrosine-phosphatase n=1 Tax=Colletotrichum chlorophyti TaxID=708187 RepID=A0A1Q8RQI8_9PEZI|nr:Tyrosine-protein phosphatase yvh1 [Colletotrichum chlorophyti]